MKYFRSKKYEINFLICFIFVYFFVYVETTFLESESMINHTITTLNPIGYDLKQTISISKEYFQTGAYTNLYPPLSILFYYPFSLMNLSKAYMIFVGLTMVTFVLLFILLSKLSFLPNSFTLASMILIASISSYGIIFELERGQSNVIAIFFCVLGIYLFHEKQLLGYKLFAILLFSISIHLKLYPLIFIVCFIKNYGEIKKNLYILSTIIFFNFCLFFILGSSSFMLFLSNVTQNAISNPYVWIGNISIRSFVELNNMNPLYSKVFLLLYLLGLVFIIWKLYKSKQGGTNPILLLYLICGTLIIPSTSHDYKLSILPPFYFLYIASSKVNFLTDKDMIIDTIIVTAMNIFFLVTLFSFKYFKTFYFQNKFFPISMLCIMCLIAIHFYEKEKVLIKNRN